MTDDQLELISDWFSRFVASFGSKIPEDQRNYDLKIEHTQKVRKMMARLTASLDLPRSECNLAAAIAICHDVGRFPQYQRYATFNDATSANHAALAVQTLKDEGVLDRLDDVSGQTILQAVALHNVFLLPENPDPKLALFARLIRDADKLDIWRVLVEYCLLPPEERASAVVWGLPDTGRCSKESIAEVVAGRMINRAYLASADDFKLLQLSWVFDLNFAESFRILAELGHIETLAGLLPDQTGCSEAVAVVRSHVAAMLQQH